MLRESESTPQRMSALDVHTQTILCQPPEIAE